MKEILIEVAKMFGLFGGIFMGMWLVKRIIRWFGPAIKMFGHKPWE